MTIKDEVIRWGTWIAETRDRGIINEPTLTIGEQMDIDTILSDAVRVVRCGDCEHYIKSKPHTIRQKPDFCSVWDRHRKPNDFCSEGELKEIRSGANLNPSFEDGV